MRSIGERLKEWRLAAGMKQDIAAMRMNMSRTTLSAIEAGKQRKFQDLLASMENPRRSSWKESMERRTAE